jgi:uncharacterized protein YecA (UPF0149 family)
MKSHIMFATIEEAHAQVNDLERRIKAHTADTYAKLNAIKSEFEPRIKLAIERAAGGTVTESAREVDRVPAMSASAGELSAEQREALLTLQRLGIDLPEGGRVSAVAVDRAIAKFPVSQRLRTKVLLARVGVLA